LNEIGAILAYKVVPNDKREELSLLLKQIWSTPNRFIETKCIYTDNVKVDQSTIKTTFKDCHRNYDELIKVLLDIFHAKERVNKELDKYHPDKKAATADLSAIFAKLHHLYSYSSKLDLKNEFDKWLNTYSTVHSELNLSLADKITYLGITMILI